MGLLSSFEVIEYRFKIQYQYSWLAAMILPITTKPGVLCPQAALLPYVAAAHAHLCLVKQV